MAGQEHAEVLAVSARGGEARQLTAFAPAARRLLADVERAVARSRPECAAGALVRALVAFAHERPDQARLVMGEALTGGAGLRDARDRLVDDLARMLERARAELASSALVADLPPSLLCGLTCRLLASRLREHEPRLDGLADELLAWLAVYELPLAAHRWEELAALPLPVRSPYLPPIALRAPPSPLQGRTRMTRSARAEERWLRVLFATVEVVARDGYAGASVAAIAACAGIDTRAFYRTFASKQHALAAANELLFRRAIATAAGAFAAGETWPARVWEAARALTQCVEDSRALAHVCLVESQDGGAGMLAGVEEIARAFAIFLYEGDAHRRERLGASAPDLPALAPDAITTAVLELGYRRVRRRGEAAFTGLLAHAVFIALAPFLGAEEAAERVRAAVHGADASAALAASAA
ncbi:MAG TPA: TetR family transcriptional regulator [Solirubrobacteraceae bacterium]|jgi:AcrR family transcriptional regulator|nr:TetR family transcriptional regulator [Solirubrobacteraceae bacterium]